MSDDGAAPAGRRRRSPRSDATRNSVRLLAVARDLVATSGPDVAFDEIARQAGVGNATVYRNFPTRGDLLAAVYADEVRTLCDLGATLAGDPSPLEGLFAWLDAFVVHVATKRPLALAAAEGRKETQGELFRGWHDSINATAAMLLGRAHDSGAIDPAVTVADLLALVSGAAVTATDTAHARRLVRLLQGGLSSPASPRAPTSRA